MAKKSPVYFVSIGVLARTGKKEGGLRYTQEKGIAIKLSLLIFYFVFQGVQPFYEVSLTPLDCRRQSYYS